MRLVLVLWLLPGLAAADVQVEAAAKSAFESGELEEAARLCEALVARDPTNATCTRLLNLVDQVSVLHRQARRHENSGRLAKAAETHRRVLRINRQDIHSRGRLKVVVDQYLNRNLEEARRSVFWVAPSVRYAPAIYLNPNLRHHMERMGWDGAFGISTDLRVNLLPVLVEAGLDIQVAGDGLAAPGFHVSAGGAYPIVPKWTVWMLGGLALQQFDFYAGALLLEGGSVTNHGALVSLGTTYMVDRLFGFEFRVEATPWAERSTYIRFGLGLRFL